MQKATVKPAAALICIGGAWIAVSVTLNSKTISVAAIIEHGPTHRSCQI